MGKIFESVKINRPKVSKFDLSHENKLSLNMGQLVPIICQEVLPGDRFRLQSEIFMRFAPMLAPIMHRVDVTTHYFFVPNRLIWDEWEDFITGGRTGTATPVAPYLKINTTNAALNYFAQRSLADYLGIPNYNSGSFSDTDVINISALPFRACQKIYEDYYRDQLLEAETDFSRASGEVSGSAELDKIMTLRTRCWEKDYFTSARTEAQLGGAVSLPVESEAIVTYKNPSEVWEDTDPDVTADLQAYGGALARKDTDASLILKNIDEVEIESTSVTINALRAAMRLQEWLEKNMRAGARYVEQILSHFGVRSSDARLQRAEYLGGTKQPCSISEVLTSTQQFNSSEDVVQPTGQMAGHGISVGGGNGFSRRFEEHGFVIGFMSVLPRTAYQNGINKMFTRVTKLDYAWPEFAHLGEQEVKNSELYYDPSSAAGTKDITFGYQSRYAEYKYKNSEVHAEMRDLLDYWHTWVGSSMNNLH